MIKEKAKKFLGLTDRETQNRVCVYELNRNPTTLDQSKCLKSR